MNEQQFDENKGQQVKENTQQTQKKDYVKIELYLIEHSQAGISIPVIRVQNIWKENKEKAVHSNKYFSFTSEGSIINITSSPIINPSKFENPIMSFAAEGKIKDFNTEHLAAILDSKKFDCAYEPDKKYCNLEEPKNPTFNKNVFGKVLYHASKDLFQHLSSIPAPPSTIAIYQCHVEKNEKTVTLPVISVKGVDVTGKADEKYYSITANRKLVELPNEMKNKFGDKKSEPLAESNLPVYINNIKEGDILNFLNHPEITPLLAENFSSYLSGNTDAAEAEANARKKLEDLKKTINGKWEIFANSAHLGGEKCTRTTKDSDKKGTDITQTATLPHGIAKLWKILQEYEKNPNQPATKILENVQKVCDDRLKKGWWRGAGLFRRAVTAETYKQFCSTPATASQKNTKVSSRDEKKRQYDRIVRMLNP